MRFRATQNEEVQHVIWRYTVEQIVRTHERTDGRTDGQTTKWLYINTTATFGRNNCLLFINYYRIYLLKLMLRNLKFT